MGAILGMAGLLDISEKDLRKEVVWAISNVCAGTNDQLWSVINANAFPALIHIAQNDEKLIKKEAVWALSNACAGGSAEQVKSLVGAGVIQGLCALLHQSDVKTVSIALEGLNRVLKHGKESFE